MEEFILGVDGGGTKTAVMVADRFGHVLAESWCGSGNYKSVGIDKAAKNIYEAVDKAAGLAGLKKGSPFSRACFGLSGLDTTKDQTIYEQIIFKSPLQEYLNKDKTIICNDSKIGLYAGTDRPDAIMIICGTGSNCYGLNRQGQEARANGWDFILGDQGSGFSIASKALQAIMKFYDGRGPSTILLDMVLKQLKLEDIFGLIEWVYAQPLDTGRIASLAKVVCSAAEKDDYVCRDILVQEAGEAELSIATVAKKLGFDDNVFDLVFVGSVFNCKQYFTSVLQENLKKKFRNIKFMPLTQKPVWGAIKLAMNLR